jgi:proteasome lid subunit RPN8/RPN11
VIELSVDVLKRIREHAESEYPKECCGLVIICKGRQVYVPCKNQATTEEAHFVICPEDFAQAEDMGEVIRIVHSHPNLAALPSEADKVGCEHSGVPWLIVNWPNGAVFEFSPSGYHAPLVGRHFHHGVLDCYSLIRDYYAQKLALFLPDFERQAQWWLKGENLYLDNFSLAGFVEMDLESLQPHDVLLMQVGSPVINHAAIYIGNGVILQHCAGRLSSRDVYGGGWRRATRKLIRHQHLISTVKLCHA